MRMASFHLRFYSIAFDLNLVFTEDDMFISGNEILRSLPLSQDDVGLLKLRAFVILSEARVLR